MAEQRYWRQNSSPFPGSYFYQGTQNIPIVIANGQSSVLNWLDPWTPFDTVVPHLFLKPFLLSSVTPFSPVFLPNPLVSFLCLLWWFFLFFPTSKCWKSQDWELRFFSHFYPHSHSWWSPQVSGVEVPSLLPKSLPCSLDLLSQTSTLNSRIRYPAHPQDTSTWRQLNITKNEFFIFPIIHKHYPFFSISEHLV